MPVSPQNLTRGPNEKSVQSVTPLHIGILALQGAFLEHANMLRKLGATPVEVRLPKDLAGLDGLIIPGGESTTIGKLASQYGLIEPLHQFISNGKAVWGTCAGLIFLAKDVGATGTGGHVVPPRLEVMDIKVDRNAFGRQVDSFEAELQFDNEKNEPIAPPLAESAPGLSTGIEEEPFRAVFIRAPKIESVGEKVEILAKLDESTIVAVRQGNLLGTAFHPELTDDPRFHHYFLRMAQTAGE